MRRRMRVDAVASRHAVAVAYVLSVGDAGAIQLGTERSGDGSPGTHPNSPIRLSFL